MIRRRTELGKARIASSTLSGAICWVGKQALLSANLVSLGEGWQLIAQAITEKHIEPRGPGHPFPIPPASTPFNFNNKGHSPQVAGPSAPIELWGCPSRTLGHHTRNEAECCRKTEAKGNKNYGQPCPHHLSLARSWV